MTLLQTRQLGIEFERRVLTILPTTQLLDKLDTETIYSFLNQYQSQYVHEIYRNLDKVQAGTQLSIHIERVLQCMLKSQELALLNEDSDYAIDYDKTSISDTGRSKVYKVPTDYLMYVRSVSKVDKTFSWIGNSGSEDILPNVLTSQIEVWKLMETPHNKLRILRYPAAILSQYTVVDMPIQAIDEPKTEFDVRLAEWALLNNKPTLTIVHDRYTNITGVKLLYYKEPQYFDIMTSTPCELPMDCFNDLVEGAVQLYINYVRGGIRLQEEDGRRDRFAKRQEERDREREQKEEE